VSKAFTRESDEGGAEQIPSIRPRLPSGARNYITKEGAQRLTHRLNGLLERRRGLATAGNEPDPIATADRRRLESDIRKLQAILDSVVVAEIPDDHGKVAFGACVSIRRDNGEEEEYQIVGVDEIDPERGQISWISPLARVLLSRRAGDRVRFQSPAGADEVTIVKVGYPGRGS
jgi:transcription elongation factor GreB